MWVRNVSMLSDHRASDKWSLGLCTVSAERAVTVSAGPGNSPSVCYVVLCCVVLCCVVLCCGVLYCIVLFCILFYCVLLCCVMLCCVVFCCIVLYCFILYYALLYCIMWWCFVVSPYMKYHNHITKLHNNFMTIRFRREAQKNICYAFTFIRPCQWRGPGQLFHRMAVCLGLEGGVWTGQGNFRALAYDKYFHSNKQNPPKIFFWFFDFFFFFRCLVFDGVSITYI